MRGYVGHTVSGLSVWADIRGVKGHWYEVRPTPDPVDTMSVTGVVYVMGVPPTDAVMVDWSARGLITVHGGGANSSLIELGSPISPRAAALIARLASAGHDIESALGELLDRYLGASRGKLF